MRVKPTIFMCLSLLPALAVSSAHQRGRENDGNFSITTAAKPAVTARNVINGMTIGPFSGVDEHAGTDAQGSLRVVLSASDGAEVTLALSGVSGKVTTFEGNVVTIVDDSSSGGGNSSPTGSSLAAGSTPTGSGPVAGSSPTGSGPDSKPTGTGSGDGDSSGNSATGGSGNGGKNGAIGLAVSKTLLTGLGVALGTVGASAMLLF
ncbi:hypothetical protein C8Q79DRAFT_1015124 [Trametes meyenii]|nr:hypothetical protein C8Q79DRAFT_1015124 [Trametes meyenii]